MTKKDLLTDDAKHMSMLMSSRKHPYWSDVTDAQWSDWKWQQSHRVRTIAKLREIFPEAADQFDWAAIEKAAERFPMGVTPYYLSLVQEASWADPIWRQVVPSGDELRGYDDALEDPLAEEAYMPVPGITHRYPDRVLFYTHHHCAMYCRHCNRRRKVGDPFSAPDRAQLAEGIRYIQETTSVRDVLISGGDPLTYNEKRLEFILSGLREAEHLDIIRIATRNPVTLPQRVTPALTALFKQHHPVYVSVHFNHLAECTPEAGEALNALADAGCVVGNQMVLLKGVNEDAEMVREMNRWLLRHRCRPYYIFQCDSVEGASHFKTPTKTGVDLIQKIRGWTSGLAVPHYVVDLPKGGGKVSLGPNYLKEHEGNRLRFENYAGEEYDYIEGEPEP